MNENSPTDSAKDGRRTTHPPLYCEVCTSRVIITVPESRDEYALECECDTVDWTDQWPSMWTESATRELI